MIILDIDGTIADDRWRRDRVRQGVVNLLDRYHDYHSLAPFDDVVNQHLFVGSPHTIVIFTARNEHYRAATEEWLRRNGAVWHTLRMRPRCDYQSSRTIKLRWARELLASGLVVAQAYDDNPRVVAMYRELGIPTTLVKL